MPTFGLLICIITTLISDVPSIFFLQLKFSVFSQRRINFSMKEEQSGPPEYLK
jgi:hypothetical protein